MQARRDAITIRSPLPFDRCSSVIREALQRSELDLVAETAVHRHLKQKLGLEIPECTVFTVWDPLQVYQALRADGVPGMFATFGIAVLKDGPGSIVVAPTGANLGTDTSSGASYFAGRSLWEKTERVLAYVAAMKLAARNRNHSIHFPGWLRRGAQDLLRLVNGGAR